MSSVKPILGIVGGGQLGSMLASAAKKIKELSDNNQWNIKEFFKSDYIASKDVNAWLGLAEVIKK